MNIQDNIYPIEDRLLQKSAKEALLNQKGMVIWLVGLSGSGKSTIAQYLEAKLYKAGFLTKVLDGDNIRSGLNKNLAFSEEDRTENIRRISEVAKLFMEGGIITIASFISPTEKIRTLSKAIIGQENYIEVYVNTSLEECMKRDVKGLYAKASKGLIKNFTGISSVFEAPKNANIVVETTIMSINESVQYVYDAIINQIKY